MRRREIIGGAVAAVALLVLPPFVRAGGTELLPFAPHTENVASLAVPTAAPSASAPPATFEPGTRPPAAPVPTPGAPASPGSSGSPGASGGTAAPASPGATRTPVKVGTIDGRPTHGEDGRPLVYLTFDDGPSRDWTPKVLDLLDAYGARATFFEVGEEAARFPEVAADVRARGHAVGNHTYTHPWLTKMTPAAAGAEVDRTETVLGGTRCLRPPGGFVDDKVRTLAAQRRLTLAGWTLDTNDWRRPGTAAIAATVKSGLRPGAVVLMHDGGGDRSQSVAALTSVLEAIRAADMEAVPLPECT